MKLYKLKEVIAISIDNPKEKFKHMMKETHKRMLSEKDLAKAQKEYDAELKPIGYKAVLKTKIHEDV